MIEEEYLYNYLRQIKNNESGTPMQPYFVPAGYFENLASQIRNTIIQMEGEAIQEIVTIAPVLSSISKKMPYSTPASYWHREKNGNKPRNRYVFFNKTAAVAASIAAIIIITFLLITMRSGINRQPATENSIEASVNRLSDDQIAHYLELKTDTGNTVVNKKNTGEKTDPSLLFKNVSNEELTTFLNDTEDDADEISFN